ncbi:universal stress protein [Polaribacter sp. L3A8]|uniref:universal stress protein n=1 Tax=Polaribacter sp. L3A8 TaxID=2686361 RepID=UPI00131B6598|nr:universal stress protein [Polaribacter sp. L3A8]
MKKILIAIDYDQTAQKVAEKGFSLAKTMNAEVTLLHVISKPILYYTSYNTTPLAPIINVDELKDVAQNFLDKTKLNLGDESIQTLVKEGDTSVRILESAKTIKADVIVMGTHSRQWLENILIGSVAESVLKDSTLPLYIIPTKKEAE